MIIQQQNPRNSFAAQSDPQSKVYQRKLFNIVASISIVVLLIIFERIFYDIILENESKLLHDIQSGLGLINTQTLTNNNGRSVTLNIFENNIFWRFLGNCDKFKYNFLAFTAYIGVMYVSVDGLIAVKVGFMGLYSYFMLSSVGIIYSGPRPFWYSPNIVSPVCLTTFSHPSNSTYMLLFISFYTIFCFRQRIINRDIEVSEGIMQKYRWIKGLFIFFLSVIVAFKYIMGVDFLANIALGILYFLTAYNTLKFLDSLIDQVVQKSTILERSSKKYVFYWLFCVLSSLVLVSSLFISVDFYSSIDWIKNYIQCAQATNTLNSSIPYDEVLGPWFTFIQSTALFGLAGAAFGAAYTYRNTTRNYSWFRGEMKHRVMRGLILFVSLIPSFLLTLYQSDIVYTKWVRVIGVNEFFLSAFHYAFLYFFIFGGLPALFKKFGLISEKEDERYSVLGNRYDLSFIDQSRSATNQQKDYLEGTQENE